MPINYRKLFIAIILILAAVGIRVFIVINKKAPEVTPVVQKDLVTPKVIGQSVQGRAIESYSFGDGATHLAFVGGIHGGYEWNSVVLAYTFIDYLKANPEIIPKNLTIDVIPSANPDGVYKVTGKEGRFVASDVSTDKLVLASGRFNAHEVDLNRNFDCKWQPKSTWQSKTVSAGTKPFSEPEAQTFQNFVAETKPIAVIFWHSQSNGVYASQCKSGILSETLTLMNTYSIASGYPAVKTFSAYETTGAAEDWLAGINIPAVTVELKTHETVEWTRNLAGIKAVLQYYGQEKK